MAAPNLTVRKRQFFILGSFSLILILLAIRVGWIQLVQGAELKRKAFENQTKDLIVRPQRGTIFDTNGIELAKSASVEVVSVIPKQITDPEKVARKLSEVLGIDYEKVLMKVSDKKSSIHVIKRRVEKETTNILRKWISAEKIQGIKISEDTKRYYPYDNLACYVIGFTGDDNQGLEGIELFAERILKGVPGRIVSQTDASGREMPFKQERFFDPQSGNDIYLTIDENIQHNVENHLESAVLNNKCAGGGIAIVMRPKTGEILALAVKPDYNLNKPFEPNQEDLKAKWNTLTIEEKNLILQKMWRNRAIADTYEPGSTFKIITAAAALEEDVVKPDTKFVCTGSVTVLGQKIKCWRFYNPHGVETFKEGVQNSCNPVFVETGLRLGKERFFKYIKGFGFQEKTGIDLPGETEGIFHDINKVGPIELATISFGQRIQITPIQLITAVSAIANGGRLMKPQLIKEVRDNKGNIVQRFEPKVIRQVISPETSAMMRDILESVVTDGTGKNAYVKGYRVAGKTGTADQKKTNTYIASFVGFAPADDPEVAVLVILDDPKGEGHQGGMIAAPVVGKIMTDILPYLKVKPRFLPDEVVNNKEVKVPEVRGKTLKDAVKILKDAGLEYRVNGENVSDEMIVVQQSPKPEVIVTEKSQVILFMDKGKTKVKIRVPDLRGKTVLEATKILKNVGLNIEISGKGKAISQEPEPGVEVPLDTKVRVKFEIKEME